MNTSEVENRNSLGKPTAWLRLFIKTLAVRGKASCEAGIYTSKYQFQDENNEGVLMFCRFEKRRRTYPRFR